MRVVCVGPHPDDVELQMGATVASLVADGHDVVLVDLTDGEPTPFGDRETRLAEAAAAAKVLGIRERRTLTQPNRSLADTVEARKELAEVFRELRPDLLFLPHAVDAHPDHVAAAALGDAARFWAKLVKTDMKHAPHQPPRALYYRPGHARVALPPSFVLDVSAHHAVKMRAVACYASQFSANPLNREALDAVETSDTYFGRLIRVERGEPFYSVDVLGLRGLTGLT